MLGPHGIVPVPFDIDNVAHRDRIFSTQFARERNADRLMKRDKAIEALERLCGDWQ